MTAAASSPLFTVVPTRYGPLGCSPDDAVIGRCLREYGEWAAREIDLLLQYAHPGDTVVDVGANIGTHTVPMAQRVGRAGAVHAFEPQRLSFQMLCANAMLNNLTNVHAERVALGREDGTVRIPVYERGNLGNVGSFAWGAGGDATLLRRLDDYGLRGVRLMKIDVEGMEVDVLEGARGTIAAERPVLYVENNVADRSTALIDRLFDLGYRCWWHLEPYFNPENFNGNPVNFLADLVDRPEVNMLCLPAEAAEPEGLVPVRSPQDDWRVAWSGQ